MNEFFRELFEYNNHFNQKLIEIFLKHPEKTSEKSIKILHHILKTHQIWNCRIAINQNLFDVWRNDLPPTTYKEVAKDNYESSFMILDKFDIGISIQYSDTAGQIFTQSIRDILFHIINHATYYRGQIAIDFIQNGIEPVEMDYLFYKKENQIE